jgi:hypothetical protein
MKIAISVPDGIFEARAYLARQSGVSRSQLYSDAVVRALPAVTLRSVDDGIRLVLGL